MKINITDKRRLGNSGLKISPTCLGTMMFGGRTNEQEARGIIDHAFEKGVNFIDTADVYNKGISEEIVGRGIAANRSDWVLASKVGNPMGKGTHQKGLSRKWMLDAIDQSLERLKTDYLDIWYLHLPDPQTPIEETLETISQVLRSGKTRYWGVSNYRGWQIADICLNAARLGVPRPIICQPYYNAMNRAPEVEVLPACKQYGLGVAPYSPLARGILTGKYQSGKDPDENTRLGQKDGRMLETEFREQSLQYAHKITEHCQKRDITPISFAILWLLNNALISSVIAGPRTQEQWESYCDALDPEFTEADEAILNQMVSSGHPSTPGYNDPKYPITGRPLLDGPFL